MMSIIKIKNNLFNLLDSDGHEIDLHGRMKYEGLNSSVNYQSFHVIH